MCRVADVAMAMVNRAIDMAEETEDPSYYMDFVKLHKLLYLGQCYMMINYGRPMFDEKIFAHKCGPYVDGLSFIPGLRGFDEIRNRFSQNHFIMPSFLRLATIEWVLSTYGACSTDELVEYSKSTPAYSEVAADIAETHKPLIPLNSMKRELNAVSA